MSPAVLFVPVEYRTTDQPIAMLADPIDPTTGELLSIERGFDPTDAAVVNALRTVRGSGSAVEDVGQRLGDVKLIKTGVETLLREEVRLALRQLVELRQIDLLSVDVLTEGTDAAILVTYRNIARDAERQVWAPIGALLGKAA